MYAGKVLLGVGRDRHGKKTHVDGGVYYIVDIPATFLPKSWFASLQVNETGAGLVGRLHIIQNIVETALTVACASVHTAMLAAQIAFVGYEKYGLERSPAAEETGAYEPLG